MRTEPHLKFCGLKAVEQLATKQISKPYSLCCFEFDLQETSVPQVLKKTLKKPRRVSSTIQTVHQIRAESICVKRSSVFITHHIVVRYLFNASFSIVI